MYGDRELTLRESEIWGKINKFGIGADNRIYEWIQIFMINICSDSCTEGYLDKEMPLITNTDLKWRYIYFHLMCAFQHNLGLIVSLVNRTGIDLSKLTISDHRRLVSACQISTNLDVIRYVVKVCKINFNPSQSDHWGNNFLMSVCQKNANPEVVEYFMDINKMYINHVNYNGDNCLTLACKENPNLGVIKYLIHGYKMDVNHRNNNSETCLMSACRNNTLEIIQYLVEEIGMDVNQVNAWNNSCLTLACSSDWYLDNLELGSDESLEIVRYLVEKCQANVNQVNDNGKNCLGLALDAKKLNVIIFLIESTDVKISFQGIGSSYVWERLIGDNLICNFHRFSETLHQGIDQYYGGGETDYDKRELEKILKTLNPCLLLGSRELYQRFNILDPLDPGYKFSHYV